MNRKSLTLIATMLLVSITSVFAPLAGAQKNQKKAESDTTKTAPALEFSQGLFAVASRRRTGISKFRTAFWDAAYLQSPDM